MPRLFAANFIAAYIHDMVCDLEARGWIALDLDTVVQTPDIQGDLALGLADAGVHGPYHWEDSVLFIHYGQPYHIQMWSSLHAFPGRKVHFAEQIHRENEYTSSLPMALCLFAAHVDLTIVRYQEVGP